MTHLSRSTKWMFQACLLTFFYANNVCAKTEQDVKAAYLYNFIKFIHWPSEDDIQHLSLCVLGHDAINDKLQQLSQKEVRGKPIQVVNLNSFDAPEAAYCDILFVGESEEKFLNDIIPGDEARPTLTISSIDNFSDSGGMIGFVKLGNVIRFEINLKAANLRKLTISSKLLELASEVLQ